MNPGVFDPSYYVNTPHAIANGLTSAVLFVLGFFVLLHERASKVSIAFFLQTLAAGIWFFAFSWMSSSTDATIALWWAKAAYLGVPFIPAAIYDFAVSVLRLYQQRRVMVRVGWTLSTLFAIAIVSSDALVSRVDEFWWGYYPRYGWLSVPYLAFFFTMASHSLYLYWRGYRDASPGAHQRRIGLVLLAVSLACLSAVDYLPKFGIAVYPFGYLPILISLGICARVVWRYRLVDITPALAANDIVATMADALIVLNQDGVVRLVNKTAVDLFGYAEHELVGKPLPVVDHMVFAGQLNHIVNGEPVQHHEITCFPKQGPPRMLSLSSSVIRDQIGQVVGTVCVASDITDRKDAEAALHRAHEDLEQRVHARTAELEASNVLLKQEIAARQEVERALAHQAKQLAKSNVELDALMNELRSANARLETLVMLDPLTELLNRRGLQQALSLELQRARRDGSDLMVLLMDLDGFKDINDILGHTAGDIVLKEIARKLRTSLRTTDHIARIGGDEFIILLPHTRSAEGLWVAEKARLAIAETPIVIAAGKTVKVTASFGLMTVTSMTASVDELLSQIHGVLRWSKEGGKNRVSCSTQVSATHRSANYMLANVLAALERGDQFLTVKQAIIRLADLQTIGYELLSRLAIEAFAMPDDFFRFSQEHNLLTLADHHCLKACVAATASLPAMMRYHVNLFPSTLLNIPVQHLLEAFPMQQPRGTYCMEISEQQIIGDPSYLLEAVQAFRRAGILVAIDDVGFGRSCLESLILLEPDIIKIDKSCIRGITKDRLRIKSLERVLKVAQALDAEVVGEGIESVDDLELLTQLGVQYGQGFFFGKPSPISDAPSRLIR